MVIFARFLLIFNLGWLTPAWALDEAMDLQAIGKLARQRGVPVMVVFTARHCIFCERLQSDYVDPMLLQAEYTDRLIIRSVTVDGALELRDFSGTMVSRNDFANRYDVKVTPTVMFFDHQGRMLTKQLIGYSSPAFYGAFLDDAIAAAQDKLNIKSQRDATL
ncbi:MAG: thioredoxin fold domain-containing protein [Gammaproteobacteria bacterium]|nr:thioredoxin fold domain-containing protein [Gammaproteobacteria bacterium]